MFKNPEWQSQIDRDGYLLMPMLGPEEVAAFRNLFLEISDEKNVRGIHSNVVRNTQEENRRVGDFIQKIFQPHIERIFEDCRFAGGTFLVKGVGDDSECALHQDWNCVDEEEFMALNIWCALEDIDERNGALEVLPGSHKIFPSIRSATLPSIFLDFDEALEPFLRQATLKAGETCLYAHNIFHGSRANHSEKIRLAVVCGVQARKSKPLHYYRAPQEGAAIEVFETDHDFFYRDMLSVVNGGRPDLQKKIGESYAPWEPLEKGQVMEGIVRHLPLQPRAFMDDALQKQFARDGYVVVDGPNMEAIRAMLDCFNQLDPGISEGFYAGFNSPNEEYKVVTSREIIAHCWPIAQKYLPWHRALFASFTIKEPDEKSVIPPHQDWNFVPEGFVSFNYWFPLTEMAPENGHLWVMPGSHRLFAERVSGPGIPEYSPKAFFENGFLERYMKPLHLQPGQAVLIDHRIIHASPPNRAGNRRVAASMCLIPEGAPTIHICRSPEGKPAKYAVGDDFFTKVTIGNGQPHNLPMRFLEWVGPPKMRCTEVGVEGFYRLLDF